MSASEFAPEPPASLRPAKHPLLRLQDLDLAVDRLEGRRAALEGQAEVVAARERVEDLERQAGEIKLAIDAVAREQRRLESDVDSLDKKAGAESQRLYDGSVANARELQSIQAEIESLRARKGRVEDRLIEFMEEREELESRLTPVETQLGEARTEMATVERTSGEELVHVRAELGERKAERVRMAAGIDPEMLELYEDLRRQKKGVGAAALVEGVCQGCHQKLSAVYASRLKHAEGVRRCEYCRRILIFD